MNIIKMMVKNKNKSKMKKIMMKSKNQNLNKLTVKLNKFKRNN